MITSVSNSLVKQIRSLTADRKARRSERIFVAEGIRLVADLLEGGGHLAAALYDEPQLLGSDAGRALLGRLTADRIAQPASQHVVAAAADTRSPQGVVALFRWPEIAPSATGMTLLLDALHDPGNLGTLVRSAEAAGVGQVICAPGSADAYAPKVVRAAMGAHTRVALMQDVTWEQIDDALYGVDHIYAAAMGATMPYYAADWRQRSALIVGGEAHGLSDDGLARTTQQIAIPMRGGGESLNAAVAGSIILFEALRQRSLGRS